MEYLSVLQSSALSDMFYTLFVMVKDGKHFYDIKRDMMNIETALLRNSTHHPSLASTARDFTFNKYDRQHA